MIATLVGAGGCKTELDNGYAVAVTVKVDASVTQAALDSVARMHVAVRGAESFDFDYDVDAQLKAREGKFLYRPGVKAGSVTFRVTLRNAVGGDVGVGETPVTLRNGKTVEATVLVSADGPTTDMTVGSTDMTATPPDLTAIDLVGSDFTAVPPDLSVADDLSAPEDLTGIDLVGVVQDLSVVRDQSVAPDMTILADMTVVADMAGCVAPPAVAPRQLAPISTSRVSSRQPTVKWAAVAGATSYTVDFCSTPGCSTIVSSRTNLTALSTTPAAALARGANWWRVTAVNGCGSKASTTWEFFAPGTSKANSTSMLGRGFMDLNKDGAPEMAASGNGTSRDATVYLNSGTALPNTVHKTVAATYPVGNVGDINGDGFGDIFIGNVVYLGSSTGLTTATMGPFTGVAGNNIAAGVGDVDGDGYGDFVVASGFVGTTGATLFFGGPSTPFASVNLPSSEAFADGAGDFDGDGFADIVTGNYTTAQGYVYFGAANARTVAMTKATIATPLNETGGFGGGVTGSCDLDGNGYPDVIIGTFQNKTAYVYFGGSRTPAGGIAVTLSASTGGPNIDSPRVQCAGDVNGDGVDDLIGGDVLNGTSGAFSIWHGSTTAGTFNTTADSIVNGADNAGFGSAKFGNAVMGLGDVNRDGFDDVIVGAVQCAATAAYSYAGSNSGIVESAPMQTFTALGNCASYYFAARDTPNFTPAN